MHKTLLKFLGEFVDSFLIFKWRVHSLRTKIVYHTHIWLKSSGNVSARSKCHASSAIYKSQDSITSRVTNQTVIREGCALYRGEAKLPLLHVCRLIRGREKPNPSSLNLLLLPSRHEKWKKEIFRQSHWIEAATHLRVRRL